MSSSKSEQLTAIEALQKYRLLYKSFTEEIVEFYTAQGAMDWNVLRYILTGKAMLDKELGDNDSLFLMLYKIGVCYHELSKQTPELHHKALSYIQDAQQILNNYSINLSTEFRDGFFAFCNKVQQAQPSGEVQQTPPSSKIHSAQSSLAPTQQKYEAFAQETVEFIEKYPTVQGSSVLLYVLKGREFFSIATNDMAGLHHTLLSTAAWYLNLANRASTKEHTDDSIKIAKNCVAEAIKAFPRESMTPAQQESFRSCMNKLVALKESAMNNSAVPNLPPQAPSEALGAMPISPEFENKLPILTPSLSSSSSSSQIAPPNVGIANSLAHSQFQLSPQLLAHLTICAEKNRNGYDQYVEATTPVFNQLKQDVQNLSCCNLLLHLFIDAERLAKIWDNSESLFFITTNIAICYIMLSQVSANYKAKATEYIAKARGMPYINNIPQNEINDFNAFTGEFEARISVNEPCNIAALQQQARISFPAAQINQSAYKQYGQITNLAIELTKKHPNDPSHHSVLFEILHGQRNLDCAHSNWNNMFSSLSNIVVCCAKLSQVDASYRQEAMKYIDEAKNLLSQLSQDPTLAKTVYSFNKFVQRFEETRTDQDMAPHISDDVPPLPLPPTGMQSSSSSSSSAPKRSLPPTDTPPAKRTKVTHDETNDSPTSLVSPLPATMITIPKAPPTPPSDAFETDPFCPSNLETSSSPWGTPMSDIAGIDSDTNMFSMFGEDGEDAGMSWMLT
ncbi:MAG: hypothetical protein COA94_06355 [Rickettsiales bacterium]|nr:MAG: hypothetical protein COA94_06355 [Rickettsiales bacterium]